MRLHEFYSSSTWRENLFLQTLGYICISYLVFYREEIIICVSQIGHGWRQGQKDHLRAPSAKFSIFWGSEGGLVNIYLQVSLEPGFNCRRLFFTDQWPSTITKKRVKVGPLPLTRTMQSAGTSRAVTSFLYPSIHSTNVYWAKCQDLWETLGKCKDEEGVRKHAYLIGGNKLRSQITCQAQEKGCAWFALVAWRKDSYPCRKSFQEVIEGVLKELILKENLKARKKSLKGPEKIGGDIILERDKVYRWETAQSDMRTTEVPLLTYTPLVINSLPHPLSQGEVKMDVVSKSGCSGGLLASEQRKQLSFFSLSERCKWVV